MSLQSLLARSSSAVPSQSNFKGANVPYAHSPHSSPLPPLQTFIAKAISQSDSTAEIELRLGCVLQPFGHERRLLTSHSATPAAVYTINYSQTKDGQTELLTPQMAGAAPNFKAGVSQNTAGGLTEDVIANALGLGSADGLKKESSTTTTHYHTSTPQRHVHLPTGFILETKQRVMTMDVAMPQAEYDIRLTLCTEVSSPTTSQPPNNLTLVRIKKRTSYERRDGRNAWRVDMTEVTDGGAVTWEVEVEMLDSWCARLRKDDGLIDATTKQLHWILRYLAPSHSELTVESFLMPHPDSQAIELSKRQVASLRSHHVHSHFTPAITPEGAHPSAPRPDKKFPGAMPVSFHRHHLPKVTSGYFVSEKTDGVRYLMVFTPTTVVLLDRSMRGFTLKSTSGDLLGALATKVNPGTILDGEVVVNRRLKQPQFIAFDILISSSTPLTSSNFSERLRHLRSAKWSKSPVLDSQTELPLQLTLKTFLPSSSVDDLLSRVVSSAGSRTYIHKKNHHLTDGVIFQPDTPYVMGTDHALLKWKYLDTATIDVEVMIDNEGSVTYEVDGGDGIRVDMTRHITLPPQDQARMLADRSATGCRIAEVGLNPATGSWYYCGVRPDKKTPNHISTVLGTVLEIGEGITATELRVRMMGGEYDSMSVMSQRAILEYARGEREKGDKKRKRGN